MNKMPMGEFDACVAELEEYSEANSIEFRWAEVSELSCKGNRAIFWLIAGKGRIWDSNGKRELRYEFHIGDVLRNTTNMLEEAMEGTDSFPM